MSPWLRLLHDLSPLLRHLLGLAGLAGPYLGATCWGCWLLARIGRWLER